jgi:hypothetical protein
MTRELESHIIILFCGYYSISPKPCGDSSLASAFAAVVEGQCIHSQQQKEYHANAHSFDPPGFFDCLVDSFQFDVISREGKNVLARWYCS